MLETAGIAAPRGVSVITFAHRFGPADARVLARRVRTDSATGARSFVVDLTSAASIAEGPLVLSLLSLRGELRRIGGRLIVVAGTGLAARLAANLRFDDRLGAVRSRSDAIAAAQRAGGEATPQAMRCEDCATTWHPRRAGVTFMTTTCRRCGGRLA